MTHTQKERLCSLDCPLGPDALLLRRLAGAEAVSSLFDFELELISEDPAVSADAVLGEPAAVRIELPDGGHRFFHGVISEFVQGEREGRMTSYRAHLRPWTWFLTRRADCRIFQNMSVPDIVADVFERAGFFDFEKRLTGSYEPRTYCVQYRESDFDFVARLLEEEGIFFFFEHSDSAHNLILTDANSEVRECPENATFKYSTTASDSDDGDGDTVRSWQSRQEVHTGKISLTDYNFEDPSNPLSVNVPTLRSVGRNDKLETYDHHPGEYGAFAEGDAIAQLRMQEREVDGIRIYGTSDCRTILSGHKFTLTDHPRSTFNDVPFLLLSVEHVLTQPSPFESGGEEESVTYQNAFTCVAASEVYRPPLTTPKPLIRGPQTAVVVGPAGEEIYVDKYGRVKVQFHWDREGKKDENSSCWVRVTQAWAGKQWGFFAHPRIDDEVIVEFLEGDPDKPIVTGCVYNANRMPPYDLPANKTQTGVKTRSSMGGSPSNFNELRFEDKKGSELVYVQAEKNRKVLVKNCNTENVGSDETISVGNDRKKSVAKNETTDVGVDRNETVGANESVTIGANRTLTVGANQTGTIGANKTETVAHASAETVGLAKALTIGGAYQVSVGAAMNETVVGFKAEEVALYRTEAIAGYKSATIGEDFNITVDQKYALEAKEEAKLTSGSSSVTMTKDGKIEISGTDVTFKTAAGKIHIDAGGIITIKGSMVKINT